MPDRVRANALISTARTTSADRKIAAAALAVSLIVFCALAPFAQVQLPAIPAFIPLNQAAFFINDLITANLLFAQVPFTRSRALLVLGAGYIYDALMIVPHTLTFPGLFSPTGLLGAGEQTTAWIYMFWHAGFPIFVIGYAILRGRTEADRLRLGNSRAIIGALVLVPLVVLALTVLATMGHDALPVLMRGSSKYTIWQRLVIVAVWLLSGIALCLLYRRRKSSALDLWLSVVMAAWIFDVALSGVFNHGRFDIGFYSGRAFGLIAATFVLVMLIVESSFLYLNVQRSQEQLVQAQKMEALGQLTGGIAHDFNNLLMVIQGAIDVLQHRTRAIEPEELLRLLRPASRAVESGVALTRGLLAFSRRQALAPKNIDINRSILEIADLLSRSLGGSVRIDTVLSASALHCFIDPNQLQNALINLAVNARDAMPNGGVLTIWTECVNLDRDAAGAEGIAPGTYALVSVTDTGTGMSAEAQRHAFEPFFTTKNPDKGTGLGLSQVYGFVSQSGGYIRLSSKLGQGTTVRMFFPAAISAEAEEERIAPHANRSSGSPAPRISSEKDEPVGDSPAGDRIDADRVALFPSPARKRGSRSG